MKYTRRNIFYHLNDKIYFSKVLMVLVGLTTLIMTAVSLISPYLYKILIDEVMTEGRINLLWIVIPSMIGLYLLQQILTGIQTYLRKKFSYQTTLETKKQMMNKFLEKSIDKVTEKDIGTRNNNLEQDSSVVCSFLSYHIVDFITSFLIAGIYLLLMLNINIWLCLISVVIIPLTFFVSHIIGNRFDMINKNRYAVQSKTNTHLFDTVQKWHEIKTNGLQDQFSVAYDEMLEPERNLNSKWMFIYAFRNFFYSIKNSFILKVMMYFVGGLLIISQKISIGELLMFISYMGNMDSAIDSIMNSKTDFLGQKAAFNRLFEILDGIDIPKGQECPKNATIYLRNIDFTYDGCENTVLERVSCEFKSGKKYLIVGKSGEGKTTLIKLLLGLACQQNGQVFFDDVVTSEIDSHDLLKKFGVVMQENMFFNLSIRENLELIAPEATEDDIIFALKAACLYDFVESLPDKIDTIIGERGVKLSGGQKQRLAIARLILHNPQLIILDEATSALDSIVESEILDNLCNIFLNNTMIVISHKPLVNYSPDSILLLEGKQLKNV